jgi:magnesium transporter
MLKNLLKNQVKNQIIDYFEQNHPHDLADEFILLDAKERETLYKVIDNEQLAQIVAYLEVEQAALIFNDFELGKQKEIVEMMEPDDAVDIIQELETYDQESLLSVLGKSSDVAQLMVYDEDETGSAMTNLVVILYAEMDVKTATKKVIKEAPNVETINTLFITDVNRKFLGVVFLKDLLKAKYPRTIKEIMIEQPYVYDKDHLTKSIQAIRNYAVYEMAVVDENHILQGMLTLDDALDIYQEEALEDFEKLAGLPQTFDGPALKIAAHRLPWLLILLMLSIPLAIVTSLFEDILSTIAILIVFQPLILGSAGNVATQTLAVTLKTMSSHDKDLSKNAYREIITGLLNGFIIGMIAFIMTYIFASLNTSLTTEPIVMSFVIGLSLWMTVFIAPIVAIGIPVILRFFKFDPAVASGPFITTIIDVAALFIYFGLATVMLGGL